MTEVLLPKPLLSPAQQATFALNGNSVLSAGAGAGKSTTLVELIINDLRAGITADAICICTFTVAAAADLTSKLRIRAHEEGLGDGLEQLVIGTIDGVCAMLVRRWALSIGVSPRIRSVEGRQLLPLQQQALVEGLAAISIETLLTVNDIIDFDKTPDALSILAMWNGLREHHRWPVHPHKLALPPLPPPPLPDTHFPQEHLDTIMYLLSELGDKASGKKLLTDFECIQSGRWQDLSTLRYGKVAESYRGHVEDVVVAITDWKQTHCDQLVNKYHQPLVDTILAVGQRYQQLKDNEQVMDFVDTTLFIEQYAQRNVFHRVYIDEAQDTNPTQLRVLQGLVADGGRWMAVGDVAQSIYGFRGADVSGFRSLQAGALAHELPDNYRSHPDVVNFVNTTFAHLDGIADDVLTMNPQRKTAELVMPHVTERLDRVTMALVDGIDEMPNAQTEARSVVAWLVDLYDGGLQWNDVCILCRANGDARQYALACEEAGVPVTLTQKGGLWEQEETLDMMAYMSLLHDKDDEQALLRVVSSPFGGITTEQLYAARDLRRREERSSWLQRIQAIAPDWYRQYAALAQDIHLLKPSELARQIAEHVNYDMRLTVIDPSGKRQENTEKFIAMVAETEQSVGPHLTAVLTTLRREQEAQLDESQARAPETSAGSVRIMTVHQSKGLEFPLTILARVNKRTSTGRDPAAIWYEQPSSPDATDDMSGLGISTGEYQNTAYIQQRQLNKQRDDEESRRLWYVAMTRAESHLALVTTVASHNTKANGTYSWLGASQWLCSEPHAPLYLSFANGDWHCAGTNTISLPIQQEALTYRPYERYVVDEVQLAPSQPLPMLVQPTLSYTGLASWRRCSLRKQLEADFGLKLHRKPLTQTSVVTAETEQDREIKNKTRFGQDMHRDISRWIDSGLPSSFVFRAVRPQERARAQQYVDMILNHEVTPLLRSADGVTSEQAFSAGLVPSRLVGSIDVMAQNDGELLLVDWKTGDDHDGLFSDDYRLQRLIYIVAAFGDETQPQRVRCWWIGAETTEYEERHRDELDDLQYRLRKEINRILFADPIAAADTYQPYCEGCPGQKYRCPVRINQDITVEENN